MTREEASNYFKRSYAVGHSDDIRQHNEALDMAIEALSEPTKTEPKWISVDERLPEEHICDDGYIEPSKSVLVTMKSGLMRVSRYWGSKDKECPWIDLSYPTTEEVLAWMPLSEPYNVEIECE